MAPDSRRAPLPTALVLNSTEYPGNNETSAGFLRPSLKVLV